MQVADEIKEIVTSIYSETDFKPRIYWKSEYNAYSKEKQLEKDIETSRINNFRIEDIQYELTYLKSEHKVDPNTKLKSIWYIFSIKNLLPKSQRTDYQLYFENVHGARVGKIRTSSSRAEFTLDQEKATEFTVYFGFHQREFKIQLSNTVKFWSEEMDQ